MHDDTFLKLDEDVMGQKTAAKVAHRLWNAFDVFEVVLDPRENDVFEVFLDM